MSHLTTHKHRESSYLRAYKAPLHLSRILYKSALFMQNKPNFRKAEMNVYIYNTMTYEIFIPLAGQKNKPNSNPNKPNLRKAKMNVNLYVIEDYRKKDDFLVLINKPNFQNGQNERNLTYNKGLQKKRLFSSPKNKPNSNPISNRARYAIKHLLYPVFSTKIFGFPDKVSATKRRK